ncbi:MAG: hypothetical protein J5898_09515, partial [Lachnospiraceae bacterium]|nr:hypothetical protein [Lachnospiraceae bacterium]
MKVKKKENRIAGQTVAGRPGGRLAKRILGALLAAALMLGGVSTGLSMKAQAAGNESAAGTQRLRDAITAVLGEDTVVGMVTNPADNKKEWELLTEHANAVTTGNELKPDCHFGYSNSICPGRETVNFRGRSMTVPKIDYSRAERFLNKV